jgi:hypothetical protein
LEFEDFEVQVLTGLRRLRIGNGILFRYEDAGIKTLAIIAVFVHFYVLLLILLPTCPLELS